MIIGRLHPKAFILLLEFEFNWVKGSGFGGVILPLTVTVTLT